MKEGSGYYGLLGNVEQFYRDYGRVITAMDQQIGRILTELDRLGIADNTVVVYASDNGFFWGEKQLIDKRWPYEESTRAILVRYPARLQTPGRISEKTDLKCGFGAHPPPHSRPAIPEAMQGKSLLPLLDNQGVSIRKSFHLEYSRTSPTAFPSMTR